MAQSDTLNPERRRHTRTQLQMTLHGIRLDPDGDLMDIFHMVDISRSGMGAMVDRPYYRGQRVVLNLPAIVGGGRRNIYASVVRCRPRPEGYQIGLKFENASDCLWVTDQPATAAA